VTFIRFLLKEIGYGFGVLPDGVVKGAIEVRRARSANSLSNSAGFSSARLIQANVFVSKH